MKQGKKGVISEVDMFNLAIRQLTKELATGQRLAVSNRDILRYWVKVEKGIKKLRKKGYFKVGC